MYIVAQQHMVGRPLFCQFSQKAKLARYSMQNILHISDVLSCIFEVCKAMEHVFPLCGLTPGIIWLYR